VPDETERSASPPTRPDVDARDERTVVVVPETKDPEDVHAHTRV
jgi:hypothetical protein